MDKPKRILWTLRIRPVDEPMLARLNRAAKVVDLPATHLVRQAIKDKLDELAVKYPQIDAVPQPHAETMEMAA